LVSGLSRATSQPTNSRKNFNSKGNGKGGRKGDEERVDPENPAPQPEDRVEPRGGKGAEERAGAAKAKAKGKGKSKGAKGKGARFPRTRRTGRVFFGDDDYDPSQETTVGR
jgi:hypothetical protein